MATIDQILQQASARGFTDKQMADARQAYYNGGEGALKQSLQSSASANPTVQQSAPTTSQTTQTNQTAGQEGPVTTNINPAPVQTTNIPTAPITTTTTPGEGSMSNATQQATTNVINQANQANTSEQQALANLQKQQEQNLKANQQISQEGIASEKQYAKDTQAGLDEYQKQLQALALDQERVARDKAQRDSEIIKSQQLSASEVDRASLAKAQLIEQENNEEAKKQAESMKSMAMINLQKIGAFGTGAELSTMASVIDTGTRLIADTKVNGAYATAKLKQDINQAQLAYTTAINSIIDDTEKQVNTIKTKLVDDIYKIQNNKLLSEKQKNDKILALKDNYQKQESTFYADTYSRVAKQNEVISQRLAIIQTAQAKNEESYANRITSDIASGAWTHYTPEQKETLARSAGLTVNQINNNIRATVNKAIDAGVKSIMGTTYVLPSATFAEIQSLAQQKANLGIDYQTAVTQAIQEVVPQTKDYKDMQEAKKLKASLENQKTQAEIGKIKADVDKTGAEVSQMDYENQKMVAETQAKIMETQDTYGSGNSTYKLTGAKRPDLLNAGSGSLIPTTLNMTTNKNGGMECAEYVSSIIGRKVGNTYSEKLKTNAIPSSQATIGDVAVWKPSGSGQWGHAGLIVGESENNWIIKSSNLKGDGKISVDTIPKSTIQGYQGTNLGTQEVSSKQSAQDIISKYGVTNETAVKQIDKMVKSGNISGAEQYANNTKKEEKKNTVTQIAPIYNSVLKTTTDPVDVFSRVSQLSNEKSREDVANLMLTQGVIASNKDQAVKIAGAKAKEIGKTKWYYYNDEDGIHAVYVKSDGSIDGEVTVLEKQ